MQKNWKIISTSSKLAKKVLRCNDTVQLQRLFMILSIKRGPQLVAPNAMRYSAAELITSKNKLSSFFSVNGNDVYALIC